MWWGETIVEVASAVHAAMTGLAFAVSAVLVMYISARANTTSGYQSRRSIVLLEAARTESRNRRQRDASAGSRVRQVVCLSDDLECRWWSDRLGISPHALRAIARAVGPMVADIERHIGITERSVSDDYRYR